MAHSSFDLWFFDKTQIKGECAFFQLLRIYTLNFTLPVGERVTNPDPPVGAWLKRKRRLYRGLLGKDLWFWGISSSEKLGEGAWEIGETKKLSFESLGLPGIVTAYASGKSGRPYWPTEGPPEEIEKILPRGLDNMVSGEIVGPVKAPKKFNAISFANYIVELKNKSYENGWIETVELSKALSEKLNEIRTLIADKKKTKAKIEIGRTLKFLEKIHGKELLSEAYGLLKYNLQYLNRRI